MCFEFNYKAFQLN